MWFVQLVFLVGIQPPLVFLILTIPTALGFREQSAQPFFSNIMLRVVRLKFTMRIRTKKMETKKDKSL